MLLSVITALFFVAFTIHTADRQQRSGSTANQPQPYEDAEAYEVYSAVLPSEWIWSVQKAKTLAFHVETRAYGMCLRPEGEFQEIMGQAISEYIKLSQKTWLLQRHFNIEKPYVLITSDELKRAFEDGGWEKFYKRHPNSGGWIELSAVGFNTDKTVAVVYVGHSCGLLCGGGGFHVLQKKDAKWAPLKWKGTSCSSAS